MFQLIKHENIKGRQRIQHQSCVQRMISHGKSPTRLGPTTNRLIINKHEEKN